MPGGIVSTGSLQVQVGSPWVCSDKLIWVLAITCQKQAFSQIWINAASFLGIQCCSTTEDELIKLAAWKCPCPFPLSLAHFLSSVQVFHLDYEIKQKQELSGRFTHKNNWLLCYSGWDNPVFLFQVSVGYRQCGRYMCPVLPNLPTGPVPHLLNHPDVLVCKPFIFFANWHFQIPKSILCCVMGSKSQTGPYLSSCPLLDFRVTCISLIQLARPERELYQRGPGSVQTFCSFCPSKYFSLSKYSSTLSFFREDSR